VNGVLKENETPLVSSDTTCSNLGMNTKEENEQTDDENKKEEDNLISIPQCIICLEEFNDEDDITILPCCHQYHAPCVQQWLLRRNNCPCCRALASTVCSPANTPILLSRALSNLDEDYHQEEEGDDSDAVSGGEEEEELMENRLFAFFQSR